MLTYHQATVALAGLSLAIKPETVAHLDACEQRLGHHLPAAVREWYALDPPTALMGLGDNLADWPYGIADLGKVEDEYRPFPAYNPLSQGYLAIMRENQSVVLWAVCFDNTDDPPVVVRGSAAGWRLAPSR